MTKTKMDETLERISGEINWDNWRYEGKDGENEGDYWKVTEVLSCRLAWIADLASADENDEETLDTLRMVQEVLIAVESASN